ncbi:MAG: hypothetical protein SFZ03_05335 [Candidatus Melainabacteria bacterium]|nr:hypothetical protein [Candidatus Melainabacteria bacterium]
MTLSVANETRFGKNGRWRMLLAGIAIPTLGWPLLQQAFRPPIIGDIVDTGSRLTEDLRYTQDRGVFGNIERLWQGTQGAFRKVKVGTQELSFQPILNAQQQETQGILFCMDQNQWQQWQREQAPQTFQKDGRDYQITGIFEAASNRRCTAFIAQPKQP